MPRLKLWIASTRSTIFPMGPIYPFRAWRYNPSAVRLNDMVTQPCNKISSAMQAYWRRSPYRLVRILSALPEHFDAEGREGVYTRAVQQCRAAGPDAVRGLLELVAPGGMAIYALA